MTDKRITELTELTSPSSGDVLAVVNTDITKKITIDNLRANEIPIRVGDTTDYLQISSAGILTLVGEATVWDDLRVPTTSTKLGGSKDPNFVVFKTDGAGSQGVFAHVFDKTTEEELYFSVQLPHSWKEGSLIYPHVHWCPIDTDTKNVVWGLEYTWTNIDAAFGNTTIDTVIQAGSGIAYQHQLASFSAIDGTGKTHSSMLMCRVFRQAGSGSDTYDNDAALLEIDFHYEINTLGDETLPG